MNIDVDVDAEDLYEGLSHKERQYLVEWLIEDGYINENQTIGYTNSSPLEIIYLEHIDKLRQGYYQLSKEEQEILAILAKKVVI